MSRIEACFKVLANMQRKALVPYITAGDPEPAKTVALLHILAEAGADLIELGVPFSDPMADGPVIQRASERALLHHVSLTDVLSCVARFRASNTTTPIVLMGYLNPVEVMGYDAFAGAAQDAGVDGVLTVDLPPEEGHELNAALTARNVDPIFLIAPTTTEQRIDYICRRARGFIYYVSLKGVTGAGGLDEAAVARNVARIRHYTELPICVGFGIKDAAAAARMAVFADGVVVGSALVARIEQCINEKESPEASIAALVAGMREALDWGCVDQAAVAAGDKNRSAGSKKD